MRIFVAGATGAIGLPFVRQLIAEGHHVTGLARTARRTAPLKTLGARVVIADALNAVTLRNAVVATRPDVVVHALTAIPRRGPLRASDLTATNRLRILGTKNLLAAAICAGASRIIAESMVFIYGFGDLGDTALTEEMPGAREIPASWLLPAVKALLSEEAQIINASQQGSIEGVILRFGGFYGSGAGIDIMMNLLQWRLFPLPKQTCSRGVPWVHTHDAASAVVSAMSGGRPSQTYNIVDDEAAPARKFIEYLAEAIRAPKPLLVPNWVLHMVAPFVAAAWFNTTLKVSNEKAKQELGWIPQFKTYRDGIAHAVRIAGKSENR